MQERVLQRKIISALKDADFFVRKVSAENNRGLPDLLVIGHGVTILVEIKTPTGHLSKLQEYTILEINNHGGTAKVWRSFEDAKRFINRTTGSNQLSI